MFSQNLAQFCTQFFAPNIQYSKCLLNCTPENSQRMVSLVQDTMREYDIKPSELKLLVTDAVSYMLLAGQILKRQCNLKMIHQTCLCHGLHRVCEYIKDLFPKANQWITANKKIFRKSPLRTNAFKQKNPDLALPPQPVTTRWGV